MPRLQSSVSRTGGGVYRHRLGLAPGYAAYDEIERRLGDQSPITVPTIVLDGQADGNFPATDGTPSAAHFTGPHTHRQVPNAGHNLPQEHPEAFAYAVLELARVRGTVGSLTVEPHRASDRPLPVHDRQHQPEPHRTLIAWLTWVGAEGLEPPTSAL